MKSYSRPNVFRHNTNIDEKGLIKYDSNCHRYNADGFCSHAIAVSLQTKSLKKYACVLSKCEERNATPIVPQKIDIKKVGRKSVARSRKKQIGSPEKEVRGLSQNNVFINPNESLATSGRITEGIKRLPAPMVTFPAEFIEGLFQGMLNADAAAPPHDLIQVFNRQVNNLNDEIVLFWQNVTPGFLFVTDVPLILKEMGRGRYHHLILSLLKSLDENATIRDEVSSSSIKCIFSCFL